MFSFSLLVIFILGISENDSAFINWLGTRGDWGVLGLQKETPTFALDPVDRHAATPNQSHVTLHPGGCDPQLETP